MKVLLISIQGIGDTILMTPAIKYLHRQGCEIDMVSIDNGSEQIIEALGLIGKLFIYQGRDSYFKNIFRLKKEIEAKGYDKAYAMYPNGKRENILSFILGIRNKGCVFKGMSSSKSLRFLLRETMCIDDAEYCKNGHYIINNLDLVKRTEPYQDCQPLVAIPEAVSKAAVDNFPLDKQKFILLLHLFSKTQRKCWDIDNFRYVCQRLIDERGIEVIVVGTPNEEKKIDEFIANFSKRIRKFISENILLTANLITRGSLFLGNDSSLLHIAAALGKPAVSIYGFSELRRVIYGENSVVIRADFDCSPCYNFEKPLYNLKGCSALLCLEAVDKERVYNIVTETVGGLKQDKKVSNIDYSTIEGIEEIVTLRFRSREIVLKKRKKD